MIDQKSAQQTMDRRQVIWQVGFVILIASAIFMMTLRTFADPDLWGHLRFGLDMVAARSFIFVDPYSYVTSEQVWINHEWLTEVLMAGAWLAAETTGLVALKTIVLGFTLGLIYFHLFGILRLAFLRALAVLIITVVGMLPFVNVLRPQLFTYLLFAATLVVIYLAECGHYRWLWLMPLIVVAWVNLHGGFLAGCGILGLWTVAHLALHSDRWRAVAPPVFVTTLAILVNPYGVDLLIFLLRTATGARIEISDWQPLELATWPGAIYLGILAITVTAIYYSQQSRKIILLAIFTLTALMPLVAIRHLPLMAIAFSVFVGEHVGSAWQRRGNQRGQRDRSIPVWMVALPFAASPLILLIGIFVHGRQIEVPDELNLPTSAIQLLATSAVNGNLVTDFSWGEYLIWHVGPRLKVSIDGRRETIYAPEIYAKNLDFRFGRNVWDAVLSEYPTDAALVIRGSAADNLLRLYPDWLLIYEDANSALFVNQSSPVSEPLQRAAKEFVPPPPRRFFP